MNHYVVRAIKGKRCVRRVDSWTIVKARNIYERLVILRVIGVDATVVSPAAKSIITTVGQLAIKTEADTLKCRNFGKRSFGRKAPRIRSGSSPQNKRPEGGLILGAAKRRISLCISGLW